LICAAAHLHTCQRSNSRCGWRRDAFLDHSNDEDVDAHTRTRVIGTDRILMGSDYCFPIAYERPVDVVTGHPHLKEDQKTKIVEENARRLLKL